MVGNHKPTFLFIAVEEPGKAANSESFKAVIRSKTTRTQDQIGVRGPQYPATRLGDTGRLNEETDGVGQGSEESGLLLKTSASDTPSTSTAWTFLPVDPATAQPTRSARHDIRAHVAKRQHRQRRQEAQLQRSKSENVISKTDHTPSPPSLLSSRSSSSTRVPTIAAGNEVPIDQLSLLLNPHDPSDQLHLYARQLGTSVPTIWSCYLWQERQHGQLFHAQYGQFKGWGPKYLHPLILTNPAILATTVLFTGCLLRHREGQEVMSPEILRLRSKTYGFVQSAIDAADDQLSDGTILAVLKLALFEAIFGQIESYRIHMQGLLRMIGLRNGLSELGMNGYLAHLLMWFDANLSAATMTERYLVDEGFEEAHADDEVFALGVELADVKLFADILS